MGRRIGLCTTGLGCSWVLFWFRVLWLVSQTRERRFCVLCIVVSDLSGIRDIKCERLCRQDVIDLDRPCLTNNAWASVQGKLYGHVERLLRTGCNCWSFTCTRAGGYLFLASGGSKSSLGVYKYSYPLPCQPGNQNISPPPSRQLPSR